MTVDTNMQAAYRGAEEKFRTLGQQEGKGKDALIEMFLYGVDGASEGLFDTTKHKHGKGVDDAAHLYGVYSSEHNKSSKYAGAQDKSAQVQISKFRKTLEFGAMSKFGSVGDPIRLVNALVKMVLLARDKSPRAAKELEQSFGVGDNTRKLRGLLDAVVGLARAQLRADHVLSNAEIFELACKPWPKSKTLEDFVATKLKDLTDLRKGAAAAGTLAYSSPLLDGVITELGKLEDEILSLGAGDEETEDNLVEGETLSDAEKSAEDRKQEYASELGESQEESREEVKIGKRHDLPPPAVDRSPAVTPAERAWHQKQAAMVQAQDAEDEIS